MAEMNNRVWLTWETQRRNHELAKAFNCVFLIFDNSKLPRLSRYLKSATETFKELRKKPKIVFVQCPSLVLCLQASILKPFFGYKLIIDAHNAILDYLESKNLLVKIITKIILYSCDFIILTNHGLAKIIPIEAERVLILPDKLPDISTENKRPSQFSETKHNVVFISSFASDEPTEEFLKAATKLTNQCKFFITGRKRKAKDLLKYEGENIVFTDFLKEEDYENLISNADINIDLTTEDDLLVCGAYESLAVGVVGLISDTEINRETFKRGFVYTKCDSSSVFEAIEHTILNKPQLEIDIKNFKKDFILLWNNFFKECNSKIN